MHSILVLGKDGLFRLYTPFKVEAKHNIGEVKEGNFYLVYRVATNKDGELLYQIKGGWYSYKYFVIV